MKRGSTPRLRLQQWLARQSPPAVAARLLCTSGILLWLMWVVEYRQRTQEAAAEFVRQGERPSPTPSVRQQADTSHASFYVALGELEQAHSVLAPVFSLAEKTGVNIARGDYQLLSDTDGGFHVYRATLPLTGSYPAVRSFCEQLLLAAPFAAIDQLSLQREHAGDIVLKARLSLSFYLTERPGERR